MEFCSIGVYRRIDGIEHLDAKEASFGQALYTITAGGVEPSMEVKRQYGSNRDVHGFNAGCLTVCGTCQGA